jgi:hypothetical protein
LQERLGGALGLRSAAIAAMSLRQPSTGRSSCETASTRKLLLLLMACKQHVEGQSSLKFMRREHQQFALAVSHAEALLLLQM